MNSRFDRAMRGEPTLLRPNERRGFNLFMGKAQCGTCHFVPLFNGVAPPTYLSDEVEVVGVPTKAVSRGATIDPDSGRAAIDHLGGHLHAFKTPTVRNAALAGAYMHNGVYRTLDQVMNFYNHGGGSGLGAQVPNATLATDALHLSGQEQRDIIAFLKTLVDTAGLTARPSRLPRFEHSERLNNRPIGGVY
jgi:cytochrome c peroxidase